jgi:simple sugar transport system permease protein
VSCKSVDFSDTRLFWEILSPVVAVMLAFVVGGIIILVFIKSFVFTPAVFVELQGKGVSAGVLKSLQILKSKEFFNKSAFEKDVKAVIGESSYRQYGGLIAAQTQIRENPLQVYKAIFTAALSNRDGWGNVLYRATPLIFTGLAVALAFQCGLFNIGGEGQMVMGGFAITWIVADSHVYFWRCACGGHVGGHSRLFESQARCA